MGTNDENKWLSLKKNDPLVFYLLELSQAEWNLSHFPFPWVWPVSRCPSPMSVLWKHLWSQQNNKLEWCFEGPLNIQAQYKMYMRFFFPPNHAQCCSCNRMGNCWNCRPFQSNRMNTLAKPGHNKHAGRGRGTRMNAQARWRPRADSGLGTSSTWAGNGWEDLWKVYSFLQNRTVPWPPLNVTASTPESRPVGFLRYPKLF